MDQITERNALRPKLEEELPDKFISWGTIQYQKI